ncbi:hypothetical protein NLJ89_g3009 [Agrocybe chaxingu]|uniref:CBM1 domain-containing protein n=1 Tax=Agrocybe chaxingu TaxID=84603 RepID=A0A9W8K660_9AGAR|nr:hypothetical protein NLJ89_g3009 [Agrocybe chaxingu]
MDVGQSPYEKLIAQCKSNVDVDSKVDALTKLQTHFEKGVLEIPDADTLIGILKTCLRTSNLHLTNATLSALPAILPSLITRPSGLAQSNLAASSSTSSASPSGGFDTVTLRSALNAFLPTGGVVDRLGDKEKAQAKARETLVMLGGYAFRASGGSTISTKSGKMQETPIAIFERVLREGGLASKVWKVREQSILTLVHIRRAHHLFPIRPYLSLLVDCLEDTDAHVRDCARQSVVELFSGPGVTDAARADLKKEMTKKGVRKAIVDGVLAKLLGGAPRSNPQSNEGSENGDVPGGKKEYVPPGLALQGKRSRVASQTQSQSNAGPSATIARSVSQPSILSRPASRAAMVSPPPQTPTTEGVEVEPVYLASLRTTVAVNTCLLYAELSLALGPLLDPHCELLLTHLLKMAGFTKKLTAQQSQSAVTVILSYASAPPRIIIPMLWSLLQEKTVQARVYAVGHFKHYLEVHGHRSKTAIETSNGLETLEKALKKALADPNPSVKEVARQWFWAFEDVWQDRGIAILESLDAIARKQLEKACPNPEAQAALPPTTPKQPKKSSVAAAIAASRAKAKAIATAPPSLRHQATSSSYTGGAQRRAGSPSTSPRQSLTRPVSPLRVATSPPSPGRQRVVSATLTRSTSATTTTPSHSRTTSAEKLAGTARSESPSLSDSGARRRTSSPLSGVATGSSIRKALATALPASPPSSVGQISPTPRGPAIRNGAVPLPSRQSLTQAPTHDDTSLLMAQTVPIPEDDTDSEHSINLMSFSAPFEKYTPKQSGPKSPPTSPVSDSRPSASVSNALSSGSISDMTVSQQPIVEDALRARAEQAESAAERLLELVEPEDEGIMHHPSLPASLLRTTNGQKQPAHKPKAKPTPLPIKSGKVTPVTPSNRASMIMRQAALFTDSPAQNGKSASLLDVLQNRKLETGWWLKRKTLLVQATPVSAIVSAERVQELDGLIASLDNGEADVATLKRLALICMANTVADLPSPPLSLETFPTSPTPLDTSRSIPALYSDIWEKNNAFDKLFKALIKYSVPTRTEDDLAYGLIIAWEMLESQSVYLEGKEGDMFSMILNVRYSNTANVLEGTNAIRDALTAKLDPVYGMTTMHASLKVFHSEAPPSPDEEEIKAATYAFGLMALGKFILRLPAEIAEEELPRLKGTLISALNDRSSLIVRESAAASIIAAQLVLRDETHLFTLLDGLADEKKNLLTYLFDKHGDEKTRQSHKHTSSRWTLTCYVAIRSYAMQHDTTLLFSVYEDPVQIGQDSWACVGPSSCQTTSGGPNWVGYLTSTYNSSQIWTFDYAISGNTVSGVQAQIQDYQPAAGSKPSYAPWTGSNSLHATWIGINDIKYPAQAISQLFQLQENLYTNGARNFLLVNVPPFHRAPFSNNNQNTLNQINTWNTALTTAANSFQGRHADVSVFVYDSFSLYTKLLNNPSQYGFTDITTSGGSFWYDVIHPRARVHDYMAQDLVEFLKAQTTGTEPTNPPTTGPADPPPPTTAPTTAPPPPTTTIAPLPTTTTPNQPLQTRYGQCGGQGYTGPTACQAPYTCTFSNQWYSQCL